MMINRDRHCRMPLTIVQFKYSQRNVRSFVRDIKNQQK